MQNKGGKKPEKNECCTCCCKWKDAIGIFGMILICSAMFWSFVLCLFLSSSDSNVSPPPPPLPEDLARTQIHKDNGDRKRERAPTSTMHDIITAIQPLISLFTITSDSAIIQNGLDQA